jgi:hypothetical protein
VQSPSYSRQPERRKLLNIRTFRAIACVASVIPHPWFGGIQTKGEPKPG